MKLYIPTIGTVLKLSKPWTFLLHHEYRNTKMWKWLGKEKDHHPRRWHGGDRTPYEVTLPKGTILAIDRIYIRQQRDEYDSITFMLKQVPGDKTKPKALFGKAHVARFWAKLDDVNSIYANVIKEEK